MKVSFLPFLLAAFTFLAACASDNTSGSDAANPESSTSPSPTNTLSGESTLPTDAGGADMAAPQPAATAQPAVAATGGAVQHYTCPKNCKGSGGAEKGNCPVCGTAYVHNQAFHSQGGQSAPVLSPPGSTPGASSASPAPTPEPAQNAAGVWHYTCAKGCKGGGGAAGNCATCGGPLAHNAKYHQ